MMDASPIVSVVTSKQFITTLVGLILAVLVAAVPALEPLQDTLLQAIVGLFLVLVGGQFYTDGKRTEAQGYRDGMTTVAMANRYAADQHATSEAAGYRDAAQSATPLLESQVANVEVYQEEGSEKLRSLLLLNQLLADPQITDLNGLRKAVGDAIFAEAERLA